MAFPSLQAPTGLRFVLPSFSSQALHLNGNLLGESLRLVSELEMQHVASLCRPGIDGLAQAAADQTPRRLTAWTPASQLGSQ